MIAKLVSVNKETKTINITLSITYTGSMLDSEELILEGLNMAGQIASEELLKSFDTDGSNITVGNNLFYSKGIEKKTIKAPMVNY